jgi:hypothetical protein
MTVFSDAFCDPEERSEDFVYPENPLDGMTEEERMELERHDMHLSEAMAENHKIFCVQIAISRCTKIPTNNYMLIQRITNK